MLLALVSCMLCLVILVCGPAYRHGNNFVLESEDPEDVNENALDYNMKLCPVFGCSCGVSLVPCRICWLFLLFVRALALGVSAVT